MHARKSSNQILQMHPASPQTKLASDVRCPLCGQGFLIFAELAAHASQIESRRLIQQTLRDQHISQGKLAGAHPGSLFDIPSQPGTLPFSASASLSDLLDNSI
jgi:hypothetical protein